MSLLSTFRATSLDAFDEELHNILVMQAFYHSPIHFTQHQVPLLILEWIMQSMLWALLKTLHEWLNLISLCIWLLHHGLASQWIYQIHIVSSGCPLSFHKVVSPVFGWQTVWINRGKCFEMWWHSSCWEEHRWWLSEYTHKRATLSS